jgi:hypothetical protein
MLQILWAFAVFGALIQGVPVHPHDVDDAKSFGHKMVDQFTKPFVQYWNYTTPQDGLVRIAFPADGFCAHLDGSHFDRFATLKASRVLLLPQMRGMNFDTADIPVHQLRDDFIVALVTAEAERIYPTIVDRKVMADTGEPSTIRFIVRF